MAHSFNTSENGTVTFVGSVGATVTPVSVDTDINHTAGDLIAFKNNLVQKASVTYDGAMKTAAPTSGVVAAFKVGDVLASGSQILNTGRYIIAEIGGVNYKLATFQG